MLEVLLVFSVAGEPEEISKRVFPTYDECKTFVEELVANGAVVNSDYAFEFYSTDGVKFEGFCIDRQDYILKGKVL